VPNFVKDRRPSANPVPIIPDGIFNLQFNQLILHNLGTFALFEHVRMKILAGQVGG
jgi:hypothetical protein